MKMLKKEIFLFLFLFFSSSFITHSLFAQFLEYSENEKRLTVGLGIFKNTLEPKNDFDFLKIEPVRCDNLIPFITYQDMNTQLLLGYGKFKYDNFSTEEFIIKGNFGGGITLNDNREFKMIIPIRLQTDYLKITQDRLSDLRIELGDFGLGSGFEIRYDLSDANFLLNYIFYINYSTVNFSIDYGYAIQNDLNFQVKFNRIFESIGLTLGLEYFFQSWFMTNKKYNYFSKWAGGFIGINF